MMWRQAGSATLVSAVCLVNLLAIVAMPLPAPAAEIALLTSADVPYYAEAAQGIRSALPPRVSVTEYDVAGSVVRGREIARKLRADPPDLVVAIGLKAALAVKAEVVDTPVVFCLVLHPESHGLPAPNMTGIRMIVPAERQLAAIGSMLPAGRRLGLLYDEARNAGFVAEARRQAAALGFELVATAVRSPDEVPDALRAILPAIDALWLIQDHTVVTDVTVPLFLSLSLDRKLPLFTFSSTLIQQGAVGGLVVSAREIGQQAGRVAAARLRGKAMAGGPLLDPEQSHLALNLSVAEHVGLTPSAEARRLAAILYGPGAVAKQSAPPDLIP